ncbi:MAG: UDP-3-O-acyl-N-acetylglucosamine deacetylase [Armatimonadetes bacterium]|nr:UDP-3-O-acyl-N-acetylglucosamine deacetylase [Armatimonadota bacterium]
MRRTIERPCSLVGTALLTGEDVTVTVDPAPPGAGIWLCHIPTETMVRGTLENAADVPHCTSLAFGPARIDFVEHLMAVLAANGVTDVRVEVEGSEVPLLDGSAAPYQALIDEAGVVPLEPALEPIELAAPVTVTSGGKVIVAFPGKPEFWYVLDHPHPLIGRQTACYRPGAHDFAAEVAPARTFTTEEEARALIAARGLEGADETMAIVAYADRLSAPEPFPNSFAMHKLIDLLGDLYLLGRPLHATVVAFRSGHVENRALARAIQSAVGT